MARLSRFLVTAAAKWPKIHTATAGTLHAIVTTMNNATQIQTLTIDGNFFSGALVTEHGSEMSFSGLVTSGRQVLTVHRANGTKLDGRTKYARRIANAVSVERCMRILGLA